MAKQKDRHFVGQTCLFDDFVQESVDSRTDTARRTDKGSKPGTLPEKKKARQRNGGEMMPKGRKPVFLVDEIVRVKYPFIRHQPAVLADYRNIVDIVVRDGDNEYWLGIDRHGNEVLPGSFGKKIPDRLKEAVAEYIKALKVV